MDRRTLAALALIFLVALLPSVLFPPEPPPAVVADSVIGAAVPSDSAMAPAVSPPPPLPRRTEPSLPVAPGGATGSDDRRVTVESNLYRFEFSTRGARLVAAHLKEYRSFAPGDTGVAQLIPQASDYLAYQLVAGTDTVRLGDLPFEPSTDRLRVADGEGVLHWTAQVAGRSIRLRQTFRPDDYQFDVQGDVSEIRRDGTRIVVGIGPGFHLVEGDSVADFGSYGLVTKAQGTRSIGFGSLDPGEREELSGPFEWVALKSKYFVAAVLAVDPGAPQFGGAIAIGAPRAGKHATRLDAVATLPAPGGLFSHSVYVGPQEYRRLAAIGHDFNDVNPYGWIFRPIIYPVSIWIVELLLWMHETFSLGYGWVLIVFGVMVRVLLWPLNQKAMKSSMAMQAIQPELKAIQERYKGEPERLQREMIKLYKEHGVNPLGGCLPMLIPMPVLFALFFVFANTIAFRGVPFLWLPDLSRADPFYIIPVLMGLSMFAVSKIGQMGVPPNPQMKLMTYFMPVMLTVLFLNFSSGLNLYYAVQNIASIPQQWLIARERLRRQGRAG